MSFIASKPVSIEQSLAWAQESGVTRLEAQLLLLHALKRPLHERAWLYVHESDLLEPATHLSFQDFVMRRLGHEPTAYITGQKEFFGLTLSIDTRVLDPRADTETLVEWALEILRSSKDSLSSRASSVLDLGCGSGAIALSIKVHSKESHVSAIDQSLGALEVAQKNANALGLDVAFKHSSWFERLGGERFDVIVSNPPYIDSNDPHLALLQHEPQGALVSAKAGLADIQKIVESSPKHLSEGGWLLLEHGFEQAQNVSKMLLTAGFEDIQTRFDLAGLPRCTGGQLKSVK